LLASVLLTEQTSPELRRQTLIQLLRCVSMPREGGREAGVTPAAQVALRLPRVATQVLGEEIAALSAAWRSPSAEVSTSELAKGIAALRVALRCVELGPDSVSNGGSGLLLGAPRLARDSVELWSLCKSAKGREEWGGRRQEAHLASSLLDHLSERYCNVGLSAKLDLVAVVQEQLYRDRGTNQPGGGGNSGAVVTPSQVLLLDRKTGAKQASVAVGGEANAVAISEVHSLVATFSLLGLEVQVWRLEVASAEATGGTFFSLGSAAAGKVTLQAHHELSCKVHDTRRGDETDMQRLLLWWDETSCKLSLRLGGKVQSLNIPRLLEVAAQKRLQPRSNFVLQQSQPR